jgi:hypothetical protein
VLVVQVVLFLVVQLVQTVRVVEVPASQVLQEHLTISVRVVVAECGLHQASMQVLNSLLGHKKMLV